jgi:hypothetical protein
MGKRSSTDEDQGVADDWVGPIEEAIRDDMIAIVSNHPAADGLRESAIRLAHIADRASAQYAGSTITAMRATVEDLARHGRRVDDDDWANVLSEVTPAPRPGLDTTAGAQAQDLSADEVPPIS